MQNLFDPMTTLAGLLARYFSGESGFALIAVYSVIGFILWRKRASLQIA